MLQNCCKFQSPMSGEQENALPGALIGYSRAYAPLWEQNKEAGLLYRKNLRPKETA